MSRTAKEEITEGLSGIEGMLHETDLDHLKVELASLEGRARELSACLKAMSLVGSSLDLEEVLDRAIVSAMEVMNAEASSVMLLDEKTGELYFTQAAGNAALEVKEIRIPKGQGIAGWVVENGKPVVVEDARTDERFFQGADAKTGFVTRSILAVPLRAKDKIIGVAEAINKRSGHFTDSDLPLFSAYASLAAVAIENARMHHQLLEQEIVAREIEIAKEIQTAMFGPGEAKLGAYHFFADSIPARSVGGDFFDWVELSEGRAMFTLGDVSSKGIPAALLMSNTLSHLRAESLRYDDPADCLTAVNSLIVPHTSRGMFVTIFLGFVDPDGVLHYATAGHPLPLYHTKSGFGSLECEKNPPIGILPGYKYRSCSHQLSEGDLLVVYSDGVTEAANKSRDFFGMERLRETVLSAIKQPHRVVSRVEEEVQKFEENTEQSDDLTVAVLSYGGRAKELALTYENLQADNLSEIRQALTEFLTPIHVTEKVKTQIVLAMDEACANVIRHAYGGKGGPAALFCSWRENELNVQLDDEGAGEIPNLPGKRNTEIRPGGLGLYILKDVMDEIRFESKKTGGCRLSLKKKLEGAPKNE